MFVECETTGGRRLHISPLVVDTPLSGVLHLLQRTAIPTLADAGLARLDAQSLDDVQRLAAQEAETCLERQEAFADLLETALISTEPTDTAVLLRAMQQLRRAQTDYRRWRALADNAGYYRDYPQARRQTAAAL